MKILLPGGSGQVGTILARTFSADGHEVVVLSRSPGEVETPWRTVGWDGRCSEGGAVGGWAAEFEGADVVVNLAGRSVNCRYNAANRRAILNSRLDSTRAVGRAIEHADNPPRVWLQSSTATIYAHRYDAANDEATGILGRGHNDSEPTGEVDTPDTWRFSIDVAEAWEAAAEAFDLPGTRRVLMRTAIVMSPDRGGAFDVLLGLVRRGLGGTSGDGRQYVSWIHDRDFVRAVDHLIEHDELSGPVNLAAPHPLPNAEFMKDLRDAWGARFGLPATAWMLEVGAVFLRTESELVLKSRRVVPGRLLNSGFEFQFTEWERAARELCARRREA